MLGTRGYAKQFHTCLHLLFGQSTKALHKEADFFWGD